MNLKTATWKGGFAVRISQAIVRAMGIKAGDILQAQLRVDGSLSLSQKPWSREAFAAELSEHIKTLPLGSSVMEAVREDMRQDCRPSP